jgi:hypothetical protein
MYVPAFVYTPSRLPFSRRSLVLKYWMSVRSRNPHQFLRLKAGFRSESQLSSCAASKAPAPIESQVLAASRLLSLRSAFEPRLDLAGLPEKKGETEDYRLDSLV